jgi:hypothetical protein
VHLLHAVPRKCLLEEYFSPHFRVSSLAPSSVPFGVDSRSVYSS